MNAVEMESKSVVARNSAGRGLPATHQAHFTKEALGNQTGSSSEKNEKRWRKNSP